MEEQYAPVSLDVDDVNIGRLASSSGEPKRTGSTRYICFAFLVGLGAGAALVLGAQHHSAASFSLQQPQQDTTTVSYAFLHTPGGVSLLQDLKETLHQDGPVQVLQKAAAVMDTDDQFASSCHPLLHLVGRTALDELGFQAAFGDLLSTDQMFLLRLCNAAYLHGVMENYLLFSENEQELVSRLATTRETVCRPMAAIDLGEWECYHGIGHGVLQYYRKEQTSRAIQATRNVCNSLERGASECTNGLWMDHFAATSMSAVMDASTREICDLSDYQDKDDCGIYLSTAFLLHRPRQYKEAVQFCMDNWEHDSRVAMTCIGGLGSQMGKENLNDFGPVEETCLLAPSPKVQELCINQAIDYLFYNAGTGTDLTDDTCDAFTVFSQLCKDRQSAPNHGFGPP